jgi:hypothetical protein
LFQTWKCDASVSDAEFSIYSHSFWNSLSVGSPHMFPYRRINNVGIIEPDDCYHFHVKNLPILMFLVRCKILCWAQKSILYGVWNATGSHESPKTEFAGHEIFISRVTYPSIRNFMLSSKKYTLRGLQSNRKPLEPKNGIC